ncbi:MAG: c-type cytochrome biogenesis protein CcmI [Stellaceae bacterium]
MGLAFLLIAMTAMTLVVLIFVFVPLARGQAGRGAPRESFARAVYRDQLTELERDRDRGVIDESQIGAARHEIERRLLAADIPAPASGARPRPVLAAALAVAVIAVTGGLYLWKGRPGVPDLPYATRPLERTMAAAPAMPESLKAAVANLEAKLKANPKDVKGWILLGRTEAVQRHWLKSAAALHHAWLLTKSRPDIAVAYGEVQVMADGGFVLTAAQQAFAAALTLDPKNQYALWYLGLGAVQQRHARKAHGYWQRLLAELPAGSTEHKSVAAALAVLDKAISTGKAPALR